MEGAFANRLIEIDEMRGSLLSSRDVANAHHGVQAILSFNLIVIVIIIG